jgi:NRPS condensation-like uncharacterized protein
MEQQEIITGVVPFILGQNWAITAPTARYMCTLLEYAYKIDADVLMKTIRSLQLRHDILRTRIIKEANGWQQVIPSPHEPVPLTQIVLKGSTSQELSALITETTASLYQELDRYEGPLVRFVHFQRCDADKDILLVIIHHLIFDYYSKVIFIDDFCTLYQSIEADQMIRMSPKPPSFKQFAEEITRFAHMHLLQEFDEYWSQLPWEKIRALPADYPEEHILATEETWERVQMVSWSLEETNKLLQTLRSARLPLFDVLIAALSLTIVQWTGAPFAHIMAMDAGRRLFNSLLKMDVSYTIGFLAVNRRIVLNLSGIHSMNDAVQPVLRQLNTLPHRGVTSDIICSCLHERDIQDFFELRVLTREQIFFNFLGILSRDSAPGNALWKFEEDRDGDLSTWESPVLLKLPANKTPVRTYRPISYEGAIFHGQLRFRANFDPNVYKQKTVEHFYHDFEKNLKECMSIRF